MAFKPFINNVESLQLMNAKGDVIPCDRSTNPDLFRLVSGGYGLFGVVTLVCLRLTPRVKVRRVVKIDDLRDIRLVCPSQKAVQLDPPENAEVSTQRTLDVSGCTGLLPELSLRKPRKNRCATARGNG